MLCDISINDTYAKIILTSIEALAVLAFYEPTCMTSIERSLKFFTDSKYELAMIEEKVSKD